jgi:hypothetical protein
MREKLGTVGLVLALTPGIASAQTPAPQNVGGAQPAGQTAPASSAAADAPKAPSYSGPNGYGYSDKKPTGGGAPVHRVRVRKGAPVATLPGFEQLPDGGSRLFVDLSTQVPVEERRTANSVTYVLKGAQVTHHNNTNALVTVHFNTPVYRARLVPSGSDLLFVIELRDPKAAPAYKMSAKGQGGILTVDFGKGEYVPQQPLQDDNNGPAADAKPSK